MSHWVTREIDGQYQAVYDEWFHGTTLETLETYGKTEWTPIPGAFLTDSPQAAWCYARLVPRDTPVLVTVRVPEWLLWSRYREDVDPVELDRDHGIVSHLRATLGEESADDDAVLLADGIPGIPGAEILSMLILSDVAAEEIVVTAHETCSPAQANMVDDWSDCLGELTIQEIIDEAS